MKELVVLSGKGGTGKTSLVASFAFLAKNHVLADCDVDAADLHLLLAPEVKETKEFWSGQTAIIDHDKCTQCGLCQEVCRFEAVYDFTVDATSCEGCGFCHHVCPSGAISMEENLAGHWYISQTRYGPLVHARLGIAQENTGKLVATVRQKSQDLATEQGLDVIITDGPPGIGCPVISSLSGARLALLVTEPTLSGIHDLERVIALCQHFSVPAAVCINKYDINEENTDRIGGLCSELGIESVAQIPFDEAVTKALTKGVPVIEYCDGRASRQIAALWDKLRNTLG
ncbi:MAG: ATP-binding protein [Chloroflexota bacterium]